jgi:hypothetical protein
MLAAVGIPEGGIAQLASGRRLEIEPAPEVAGAFGRFSEFGGGMSAIARFGSAFSRSGLLDCI